MKTKLCGYCGEDAPTDEHVVAKSLMLDSSQGIIIPACAKCNGEKARDDEYLRDHFAIRSETSTITKLRAPMERSALRAIDPTKPQRSPASRMLKTFTKGIVLGLAGEPRHFVTADSERVFGGLKWIVRGLYYHHQGTILGPDLDYQWYRYSGPENKRVYDAVWPSLEGPEFSVGGCLQYKVMRVAEVPDFSQWLLAFYNQVFFIMEVEMRQMEPHLAVASAKSVWKA